MQTFFRLFWTGLFGIATMYLWTIYAVNPLEAGSWSVNLSLCTILYGLAKLENLHQEKRGYGTLTGIFVSVGICLFALLIVSLLAGIVLPLFEIGFAAILGAANVVFLVYLCLSLANAIWSTVIKLQISSQTASRLVSICTVCVFIYIWRVPLLPKLLTGLSVMTFASVVTSFLTYMTLEHADDARKNWLWIQNGLILSGGFAITIGIAAYVTGLPIIVGWSFIATVALLTGLTAMNASFLFAVWSVKLGSWFESESSSDDSKTKTKPKRKVKASAEEANPERQATWLDAPLLSDYFPVEASVPIVIYGPDGEARSRNVSPDLYEQIMSEDEDSKGESS